MRYDESARSFQQNPCSWVANKVALIVFSFLVTRMTYSEKATFPKTSFFHHHHCSHCIWIHPANHSGPSAASKSRLQSASLHVHCFESWGFSVVARCSTKRANDSHSRTSQAPALLHCGAERVRRKALELTAQARCLLRFASLRERANEVRWEIA